MVAQPEAVQLHAYQTSGLRQEATEAYASAPPDHLAASDTIGGSMMWANVEDSPMRSGGRPALVLLSHAMRRNVTHHRG
jgi:hypothetical protein